LIPNYIDSLLKEARKYLGVKFDTIYLGGGTASLLNNNVPRLMNCLKINFDLASILEATIEANPDSITVNFLNMAISSGFNRISIGVQSFNDYELENVGRIHSSTQAINAIKHAKKAGFKKISADLILGLPGQTIESLKRSIEVLICLDVNHISTYCLSIEEGTLLSKNIPTNLPTEEDQVKLYEYAQEMMYNNNLIQYEISNFAKPGYECLHNINYWHGGEYIGLGPAAASHLNGKRFKNKDDLFAYLTDPTGQIDEDEQLDLKRKAAEEIILRLRLLKEGANIKMLEERFGYRNIKEIFTRIDKLVSINSLTFDGVSYRLPKNKVLVSNPILTDILGD